MPPELIIFAIIVILSLLESAAKKRTRAGRGGGTPGPTEPEPEWPWEVEPEPRPRRVPAPSHPEPRPGLGAKPRPEPDVAERELPPYRLPTYDEERSYDEVLTREEPRSYDEERDYEEQARARRTFDELLTFDEVQAERERLAARSTERPRSIHMAHADFGTDPSTRKPAAIPGTLSRSVPDRAGAAAKLARELRARDAARRAIILQEVLGPPAALRPPRFDGLE